MTDEQPEDELLESWHSVTEPRRCYEMQRKYGWELLRVRKNKDPILKWDCVFKGKTEFPNYLEENTDEP